MSSRIRLTSEGELIAKPQTSEQIFNDLTLKLCQISSAIDLACPLIPEEAVAAYSTLRLLQQSLEDVKAIAEELYDRVPS